MRSSRLTSDPGCRKSRSGLSFQGGFRVRARRGIAALSGLLIALLGYGPETLFADQVILSNGNRLEGRVEAAGPGKIRVVIDEGQSVVVSIDQVAERIPGIAPIDQLESRMNEIDAGDREGWIDAASWGEAHGVRRAARKAWRQVLRLDPHHAGARHRLGYALYRNRWVKREQLETDGLKLFRGSWMSPEEIARVRAEESAGELDALLRDASHDNRFVRENAMHRLLELRDPDLIPALKSRIAAEDPLIRMLAGRVLANYPFQAWGEVLYTALRKESRGEVRSAWVAILRSSAQPQIGDWLARDLAAIGDDPVERHSLLALVRVCPTRDVVSPLIEWIDDPAWGPLAARRFQEWFKIPARGAAEWRLWWGANRGQFPRDLGTGWLTKPEN